MGDQTIQHVYSVIESRRRMRIHDNSGRGFSFAVWINK